MGRVEFTDNYEDLSTDKGYQFKFHCDKCGNGHMTEFQASTLGMAESALRVAGSVFGGFFNTAGNSAYEIQRAVGGKAHPVKKYGGLSATCSSSSERIRTRIGSTDPA